MRSSGSNGRNMKKQPRSKKVDELRPEYDFSQLEGRGIGRYYQRCKAGPIVVLLKPDASKRKKRKATTRRG